MRYILFMMKINVVALIFFISSCQTSKPTFRTFDKPIIFDSQRVVLSLQYLSERYHIRQETPVIKPVMIVLHWTAIPTLQGTFDAFNRSTLPNARGELKGAGDLNVSSQFLIDRDGTIFQLLPDTIFARHVIGLNYCAIGVENVGSENAPLTKAQLNANEQLIRYLKKKYPIEYVIGHYEYPLFRNSPLWKETDPNYLTQKSDPGISFMKKIRHRIRDLNLKGPPIE
ncbi:MAG: peptidoglycan recognition protein family protein [Chitinophagales bacterium]|nr:peptidoglycan recognition protein family protein [Chitinophagales bacterium]